MEKKVSEKCCRIGVRVNGQVKTALEICIKNGNVYVNYFNRDGVAHAHTSYHASGQQHIKKNDDYIYWTGGPSGKWEPMKWFREKPTEVEGREDVSVIGWEVMSLPSVLPSLRSDKIFEVPTGFTIIGFKTTVVGSKAAERKSIFGFPVLNRHRFSNAVKIEVEMFGINEELADATSNNDW